MTRYNPRSQSQKYGWDIQQQKLARIIAWMLIGVTVLIIGIFIFTFQISSSYLARVGINLPEEHYSEALVLPGAEGDFLSTNKFKWSQIFSYNESELVIGESVIHLSVHTPYESCYQLRYIYDRDEILIIGADHELLLTLYACNSLGIKANGWSLDREVVIDWGDMFGNLWPLVWEVNISRPKVPATNNLLLQ